MHWTTSEFQCKWSQSRTHRRETSGRGQSGWTPLEKRERERQSALALMGVTRPPLPPSGGDCGRGRQPTDHVVALKPCIVRRPLRFFNRLGELAEGTKVPFFEGRGTL